MAVYLVCKTRKAILISTIVVCVIATGAQAIEKPQRWSRQINQNAFLNDWVPVQPRQTSGRLMHFHPPFAHTQGQPETPFFMNNQAIQQSMVGPPTQANLDDSFQRVYYQQMHPPVLPQAQALQVTDLHSTPFKFQHDMPLNRPHPQHHFLVQQPHAGIINDNIQLPQLPNQAPGQKPAFIMSNLQPPFIPQHQQFVQNEPTQLKTNGLDIQQAVSPQQAPQEEVQLLYVPLDTLYNQQQQQNNLQNARYNVLPAPVDPLQINNFYTQSQPQKPTKLPTTSTSVRSSSATPTYRTPTTTQSSVHRFSVPFTDATRAPRPKSHQPPLAMFMKNHGQRSKLSVNDVLNTLATANTIDVLDSANKASPHVFVGPSGLKTPDGYSKFELPYLSSLELDRTERQINNLPFFVAPLSYRAPNGFAKIPLPAPHVGSVVVNSPTNSIPSQDDNKNYYYKSKVYSTEKPYVQYTTAAPRTSERPKPTTVRFKYTNEAFSTPTAKSTYQNEAYVASTTPSYGKSTPRPEHFNSISSFSFGTSIDSNRDTTSKTFYTPDNFASNEYSTSVQSSSKPFNEDIQRVNDESSKLAPSSSKFLSANENKANSAKHYNAPLTSNFYNVGETIPTTSQPEVVTHPVTSFDAPTIDYSYFTSPSPVQITPTQPVDIAPSSTQRPDEVTKMKTYYREQEAFRSRTPQPTPSSETFFNVPLRSTSSVRDYNDYSTVPSQLSYFGHDEPVHINHRNLSSTPRTTVTFYTATAADDTDEVKAAPQPVHQFRFVDSVTDKNNNKNAETFKYSTVNEYEQPEQHVETYTSPRYEPTRSTYRDRQTNPAYEETNSAYNLPSELPPLSSNLPGLINSLMDKEGNTQPNFVSSPTRVPSTSTSERTVSRGRRPQPYERKPKTTESPPVETTTSRRSVTRGRRPVPAFNRTSTSRVSTTRNPNRVRYSPSTEDRVRQRVRARPTSRPNRDEETIDYQRDVLKQNYPIPVRGEKLTTTSTEAPLIDVPSSLLHEEKNTAMSVSETPIDNESINRNADATSTVVDRLADHLTANNENTEFGSKNASTFYVFGVSANADNQVETSPKFAPTIGPKSIQSENNQDEITEVLRTRKPSYIRRPTSALNRLSTSRPPTETKDDNNTKDRTEVRTKSRQELYSKPRTAISQRTRGRRPYTPPPTTTPNPLTEEGTEISIGNQNLNTFTRDYLKEVTNESKRVNELPNYAAPGEKTYYSTVNRGQSLERKRDQENGVRSTTPEPTLNDLIQETAAELSHESERVVSAERGTKVSVSANGSQNQTAASKGRRRGVWKRVRVRPVDSFETAESQNIGKHLYNSLLDENVKAFGDRFTHKDTNAAFAPSAATETDQSEQYGTEDSAETTLAPFESVDDEADTNTELPTPNPTEIIATPNELTTIDVEEVRVTTEAPEISTNAHIYDNDNNNDDQPTQTTLSDEEKTIELTTTPLPTVPKSQDIFNLSLEVLDEMVRSTEKPKDEELSFLADMKSEHSWDDGKDDESDDQRPESSSIMDEVKQKLTELFSLENDDVVVSTTERVFKINRNFKRPPYYTAINRNNADNQVGKDENKEIKASPASMKLEPVPVLKTILRPISEPSSFHKDLMESVIYATSTSTEISHETEICYRGRCIKTHKAP